MKTHWIIIMTGFLALGTVTATAADYKVKSGDSLVGIAKKNGTTVKDLRASNGLEGNLIRPGQILKLPAKSSHAPARAEQGTHVVKSGDTLWTISRQYGVSVANLKKRNDLKHPESLRVGTKLLLRRASESGASENHGKATQASKKPVLIPAPAPDVLPLKLPAEVSHAKSESFRTIILKHDESVGALSRRHGMPLDQVNSVNGWDYNADTLLAAGSEVHVRATAKP